MTIKKAREEMEKARQKLDEQLDTMLLNQKIAGFTIIKHVGKHTRYLAERSKDGKKYHVNIPKTVNSIEEVEQIIKTYSEDKGIV